MEKHKLMGKKVKIHTILKRSIRHNIINRYVTKYTHDLLPEEMSGVGWITGFRNIPIFDMEYDNGYPMPICTSGIHVVLVSLSPFQNPVYVPLDGFELLKDDNG